MQMDFNLVMFDPEGEVFTNLSEFDKSEDEELV